MGAGGSTGVRRVVHIYNLEYRMGAGGSTGGKKGQLLETMADHEESINCMVLR